MSATAVNQNISLWRRFRMRQVATEDLPVRDALGPAQSHEMELTGGNR